LNCWATAAVQEAKLDAGPVSRSTHDSVHCIDFADKVALSEAANGGVATHLTNIVVAERHQGHARAKTGCRAGRLATGVAGANYDHIGLGHGRSLADCSTWNNFRKSLLSNAESAEDGAQNLLRADLTGKPTERDCATPNLLSYKHRISDCSRSPECRQRRFQQLTLPCASDHRWLAGRNLPNCPGSQPLFQAVQPGTSAGRNEQPSVVQASIMAQFIDPVDDIATWPKVQHQVGGNGPRPCSRNAFGFDRIVCVPKPSRVE
jgi:hypothetical protein